MITTAAEPTPTVASLSFAANVSSSEETPYPPFDGHDADCPSHLDYAIGEPSTVLGHALTYSALGLRVVPCHSVRTNDLLFGLTACSCQLGASCPSPGKHPLIENWPKEATTKEWLIHHWLRRWPNANIGIVTGRGLAVIDVDPRHGGFEQLAKLEAELGHLPRDWTVQTGGGGLHIYLKVPKNAGQLCDLAPGVEIKYKGRVVTAPPSCHESGEKYVWLSTRGDEPPSMPKAWLAKAKQIGSREAETRTNAASPKSGTDVNCKNSNELHNSKRYADGERGDNEHIVILTNLYPTGSSTTSGNSSFDDPLPVSKGSKPWPKDTQCRINAAILRTRVTSPGTRNKKMMELARSLRRIPGLKDRPYWDFLPALWRWYDQSKDDMDMDWKGVQNHWKYLWTKWVRSQKWDDGKDAARQAYRAAMGKPLPEAAKRYADENLQRLVALCCELEKHSGAKLWYLSVRKVMDLLGVYNKKAHACMKQLERDGVIEKAAEHKTGSPKAQRYRYLLPE